MTCDASNTHFRVYASELIDINTDGKLQCGSKPIRANATTIKRVLLLSMERHGISILTTKIPTVIPGLVRAGMVQNIHDEVAAAFRILTTFLPSSHVSRKVTRRSVYSVSKYCVDTHTHSQA